MRDRVDGARGADVDGGGFKLFEGVDVDRFSSVPAPASRPLPRVSIRLIGHRLAHNRNAIP